MTDTLQPPAETVREPGCADVFRRLGGDPTGTATQMRSWLLIEHDGPWPADVLTRVLKAALRPERRAELATLQGEAGLRPLLVRRVRRPRRPGVDRPVTVLAGGGLPGHRWLEEITLPRLTDLGDLDLEAIAAGRGGLGRPVDGPMFLVCTHGRKDVCCASFGRPVARALDAAHPGRVWETTHVGGTAGRPTCSPSPTASCTASSTRPRRTSSSGPPSGARSTPACYGAARPPRHGRRRPRWRSGSRPGCAGWTTCSR